MKIVAAVVVIAMLAIAFFMWCMLRVGAVYEQSQNEYFADGSDETKCGRMDSGEEY